MAYFPNAAFWSVNPPHDRDRIPHHNRIKQHDRNQQQRQSKQDSWTWEEILDGKGPWTQPGEYRRPKAELEAAKAERRFYEAKARQSGWKPVSNTQKFLGGGAKGECGEAGLDT